MNKTLLGSYPFNATAKTLDLSSVSGFDFRKVRYVHNLTTHQDLYVLGDITVTATEAAGVLTFSSSTTGMHNDDRLEIIVDGQGTPELPSNAAQETGGNLATSATELTRIRGDAEGTSGLGLTWVGLSFAQSNMTVGNQGNALVFSPGAGAGHCAERIDSNIADVSATFFKINLTAAIDAYICMGVCRYDIADYQGIQGIHAGTGEWNGIMATNGDVRAAATYSPQGGPSPSPVIRGTPLANGSIVGVWLNRITGSMSVYIDGTTYTGIQAASGGIVTAPLMNPFAAVLSNGSQGVTTITGIRKPDGVSDPTGCAGAVDTFAASGFKVYNPSSDAQLGLLGTKVDSVKTSVDSVKTSVDNTNIALGAKGDGQASDDTSSWSVIALLKRIAGKFPRFGTAGTPSADVLSIQGISSGVAVQVQGGAPVGSAPVANPLSVSGVGADGLKHHLLTANDGTLQVGSATLATAAKQPALGTAGTPSADVLTIQNPAPVTSGPITLSSASGAGSTASLAIPSWANSVTIDVTGGSGTALQFQQSTDGGTTLKTLALQNTGNTGSASFVNTLGGGTSAILFAQIANINYVVVTATSYSANATVTITASVRGTPQTSSVALTAGTARTNMGVAAAIGFVESTANLTAGSSFTGASHDVLNAATGVIGSSSSYPQECRGLVTCSHAADLYLEGSNDNFTTVHRVKGVSAAVPSPGGTLFYGELIFRPIYRYYRVIGKNTSGSTSTTFLLMFTMVAQ